MLSVPKREEHPQLLLSHCKHLRPAKQAITFVRAGEEPTSATRTSRGLLAAAQDWELNVDLGKPLKIGS
jgi:hypothetical protein